MGRATVKAIALKLGNAIALPVLPYTPNNASAALPGTIGLTNELLSAILERISDQAIKTGFTNVIIMGDHGGGQPDAYAVVAKMLDSIYAPQGKHVYFCDQVYKTANDAFDTYLKAHNLPVSTHAGIPDTSEMLYLGSGFAGMGASRQDSVCGDEIRSIQRNQRGMHGLRRFRRTGKIDFGYESGLCGETDSVDGRG